MLALRFSHSAYAMHLLHNICTAELKGSMQIGCASLTVYMKPQRQERSLGWWQRYRYKAGCHVRSIASFARRVSAVSLLACQVSRLTALFSCMAGSEMRI